LAIAVPFFFFGFFNQSDYFLTPHKQITPVDDNHPAEFDLIAGFIGAFLHGGCHRPDFG